MPSQDMIRKTRQLRRKLYHIKNAMKEQITNPADIRNPEKGFSTWIENGQWFKAPTVDKKKFGKHDYFKKGEYERGVRKCKCGCFMGGFSSDGPVDPFGPCPENRRGYKAPGNARNRRFARRHPQHFATTKA